MDQDDTPTTDETPRDWPGRQRLARVSTELERLVPELAPSPQNRRLDWDDPALDAERWDGLS